MICLPQHTASEFERCSPWIQQALDYDGHPSHSLRDVLELVRSGHCHLWPGTRMAAVTYVQNFPLGKVLVIWLAGGDQQEILEWEPRAEAWARHHGCKAIELNGRLGWQRRLKGIGYSAVRVTCIKTLAGGCDG